MTAKTEKTDRSSSSVPFPWFTVEVTLWGLLLIIALGLRLLRLAAAPLNAVEARAALAAWRFAHGQDVPTTISYSPVLFSSQWLTFLIFGASDLSARILPALAGTALSLAPALLRRELGRLGALAAGVLLALSPTALTLSRTATGDVLVALGALLCATGLWRYVESQHNTQSSNGRPPLHLLCALGTALMLVSSPLAYSALLALGAALLLLALADMESRVRLQRGWSALRATPNAIHHTLGVLLAALVLLSTAFAWHVGGLAAAADLLPAWLGGFVRWPDSLSLNYPLLILNIYEPLILLTGGAGVVLVVRGSISTTDAGRSTIPRLVVLWCLALLALALIRPGHGPGDVLLVLVPLACLGGLALEALIAGLKRWGDWLSEGMYLAITAPLWAWLAVNLVTYSNRPGEYTQVNLLLTDISLPTHFSLALISVLLLLIMAAVVGLVQGSAPALRGLGLSTTLALLLITSATTWGVSQNRPADPRELLILEPTATEVRLLGASLARLSHERWGDAHAIDLTVLSDDPALAWALRDFHQTRFTDVVETPLSTSVVIAPKLPGTSELGEGYIGQSLPLRRRWEASGLSCSWKLVQLELVQAHQLNCSSLVNWLVYRRSPTRPLSDQVILWLRKDLVGQ